MAGLPERIGKAINELDIDFGRFTVVGWCVSVASLALGFAAGLAAYWAVVGKIPDDRGPALAFGLTMIAVTVGAFLALRAALKAFDVQIVKDRAVDGDGTRPGSNP